MNTPRSKRPVRYGQLPRSYKPSQQPDGSYRSGLYDERFLLAVGRIATFFPLLENEMIHVLGDLLGVGGHSSARQIFASINSHHARVKVMTSLLEHSLVNKDKGEEYDQLLIDFNIIAQKRNRYVHHIWWTHSSGRVFLAEPGVTNYSYREGREVIFTELEDVLNRIGDLMERIRVKERERSDRYLRAAALQGTPLPQRGEDSASSPPAPHTSDEAPPLQPQASDPLSEPDDPA